MARMRRFARSAAAVVLMIAALEIFGCAFCSPDTCTLAGAFTHRSHQDSSSGDDCLCCCAHLLISSTVHIEPVVVASETSESVTVAPPMAPAFAVYHPPQALVV